MIVVPDVAEIELMKKVLKDENFILKLYRNDYTPDSDSLLSSFTEANFDGYGQKLLVKTSWTGPTTVSPTAPCTDNLASATYAEQSWTCGSVGNTVYGYYVVGATTGKLMWADEFASERNLGDSDVLRIIPKFTLRTQIPC